MLIERKCAHCGATIHKERNAVNRADAIGAHLYCDRKCAGMARRRKVPLSEAERKEAKRIYDAKRRLEKHDELCAQKLAYYYANRDRFLAEHAEYRRRPENIARHNAYCRRPEYVTVKREYDRLRRASVYEDFSEAYMVLMDLEKEIDARATRYDIYMENGTINKAQTRKRALL